jgi:putative Mn2+ efflux pump MntP
MMVAGLVVLGVVIFTQENSDWWNGALLLFAGATFLFSGIKMNKE